VNRLLDIGFKYVGHWSLQDGHIKYNLSTLMENKNILYSFVCNGEIKYVGKTTQKLKKRMYGYQNPASSQSTNIKNNHKIKRLLKNGESVDIFALPDNGLLHYGNFHLNLASGLEESIIKTIKPKWNSTSLKKELNKKKQFTKVNHEDIPQYILNLHKTYFNQGFFNISIEFEKYFGKDKEPIDIYLGENTTAFNGYINRSVNTNNTPRIMCGNTLRDWFHNTFQLNDKVVVNILSPNSIKLNKIV